MKKRYYILYVAFGIMWMLSCSDYLRTDQYFKDRMTLEKVFTNVTYTEEWLAHAYSFMKGGNEDVASKNHTPHCFADDMYYGDHDATLDINEHGLLSYNDLRLGRYGEWTKQASWEKSYKGIRAATTFIHYIDMNDKFSLEKRADYKAQARFVRAYYYWLLLRKYGPVPLLPDEGLDYMKSYDELATPRSTYQECAEYISREMLLAAEDLPLKRGEQAVARPTRGAALATRAKVLLYAASPLMNGNEDDYAKELVDDNGKQLLSPDYQEEKWAKAAAAARDVMELGVYELYTANFRTTGNSAYPPTIVPPHHPEFSEKNWPGGWSDIDPFESYRALFNGILNASENPELIFTRGQNEDMGIVRMVANQMPRVGSGWNCHGLTQKQCDAYYMNDGTDCPGKDKEIGRGDGSDRLAGYVTEEDVEAGRYRPLTKDVSLQYANREPRFYASVAYNGSVWHLLNESEEKNREKQVFYYRSAGNGYTNSTLWLRTGIGVMKFVHPRDTYQNFDANKIVPKTEPAIRYADILLMYAEALNELNGTYSIPSWDGSKTYTIQRDVAEMKRGILPVRIRAGIPDYEDAVYADREEFRKKLKRERQIELMGEGQRYYDLRRWKDAPVEESLPIYGCNVLATAIQRDLFHTPVAEWSLRTSFARKMWFWPILPSELKRNKRLTQNPGWQYHD